MKKRVIALSQKEAMKASQQAAFPVLRDPWNNTIKNNYRIEILTQFNIWVA
jgi:hypothetical protein